MMPELNISKAGGAITPVLATLIVASGMTAPTSHASDRKRGDTKVIEAVIAKNRVSAATSADKKRIKRSRLPRGFVRLKDLAPGIIEDMRYATSRNFTGGRVPGYKANSCILARPVAVALARVHRAVRREGYAIKVYDCYRPARAVRSFVRWARRPSEGATKAYYPRIARNRIIPLGYIAKRSSHSRGTAVDLTLVRVSGKGASSAKGTGSVKSGDRRGSCIAAAGKRPRDSSIDMGTAWDCFDVLSHTFHRSIVGQARANRMRLLRAMQAEGFRNYRREWWHFSLSTRQFRATRDFIVD